jgi:hypothetical protein
MTVGMPKYLTEAYTCQQNMPLSIYKYSAWRIVLSFAIC